MNLQEMQDRNGGNVNLPQRLFPSAQIQAVETLWGDGLQLSIQRQPFCYLYPNPHPPPLSCPASHRGVPRWYMSLSEPWFSLQIRLNRRTWSKTDGSLSESVKRRYPFALRGLMAVVMRVAYCTAKKIKGLPPSCANRRRLYVFWNNLFQRPNNAPVSPYRYKGIRPFDTIATPVSLI